MKLKFLKLFVISLLLTLGYLIFASYPYFFSKINRYDSLGFLSVIEEKSAGVQKTFNSDRRADQLGNHLLKGEKISAKLRASENNFGILLLRFAHLSDKVSDVVAFRIKQEGESQWYYEHAYKANQFQPDQYFTFGFPPFKNSKDHTYIFEIESLSGTYKNGVGVSFVEPHLALVYGYTKNDLKDVDNLLSFISKKLVYVARNVNFMQNWQILATFVLSFVLVFVTDKKKITVEGIVRSLSILKKNHIKILKTIINKIKFDYLFFEKKINKFSNKVSNKFTSSAFYLLSLNTDKKKKFTIALLIFSLAFAYRFSTSLTHQADLFYYALGGGGDYSELIRVATCTVTNFCSESFVIYNFLFMAPLLGLFFILFGFLGGINILLYLMLILSSIVATLPYLLLSRKNWISLGGIVGGILIATNDFLTNIALGFPSDNSSLFTFSFFVIIYFLTLKKGTFRWLVLLGLIGLIDGLNKVLFLINDLGVLLLFVPLFFYEKAIKKGGSIFTKPNFKILFYSTIPLLVFLLIYMAWEYFIYINAFRPRYFLWGLIVERGGTYAQYTTNTSLLGENLFSQLIYYSTTSVIMIKRLIDYSNLQLFFLLPIYFGLFFFCFIKNKVSVGKIIYSSIFSIFIILILALINNNYYKVHEIFGGAYIYTWTSDTYFNIFLFIEILFLFILNLKYSALIFFVPIVTYVVMLIVMVEKAPFARLYTHVVVWSVILLSFLIDQILTNINDHSSKRIKIILPSLLLILFFSFYGLPKMVTMITQLNSGIVANNNEAKYLKWVNENIPKNAVILVGGQSDLVTVAENIKKPIIYSTLWTGALLIRPDETPGVKPSDFNIVSELKSKDNFKRKKYIILENDIYIWRGRVNGVVDSVFSTSPNALHADDYLINVYKFNLTLKKAIYQLELKK